MIGREEVPPGEKFPEGSGDDVIDERFLNAAPPGGGAPRARKSPQCVGEAGVISLFRSGLPPCFPTRSRNRRSCVPCRGRAGI